MPLTPITEWSGVLFRRQLQSALDYLEAGLGTVGPFGESIVVEKTPLIELNAAYGTSVKRDVVSTSGSAAVTASGGEIELSTGATATSVALLESAESGRYVPGMAAEIGCGMRIPAQPTGNEHFEWGGVDATTGPNTGSENGFWFGYDSTGVFVAIATGGTVTKTYQTDWNVDKFDGTGVATNPSGLNLDMAKGYIFQIEFTYYGHGDINFFIVGTGTDQVQRPYRCHVISVDNSVSIENPSLYLFQEANNGGDASDVSCFVGGRAYQILGRYMPSLRSTGQIRGSVATTTTRKPLVTFRRKSTDFDKSVKVLDYNVLATDENHIVEVVLNGSLTGASYAAPTGVSATETALEVDISATAITGGEVLFTTLVAAGKDKEGELGGGGKALSDLDIPRDQPVTLCARTITGTGTAVAAMNMREEW